MAKQETVIYCGSFSLDSQFFVAGTNTGHLVVWKTQAHSAPIYSLIFVSANILASGGENGTRLWSWDDALQQKDPKLIDTLAPEPNSLHIGLFNETIETNGLAVDRKAGILYSATGDCNAYAWDLNTKKYIRSYTGHTEYLHCIKFLPEKNTLLTGGEDGLVKVWDPRTQETSLTLDSAKASIVTSTTTETQHKGAQTFVAALDTDPDGNWLVCGGTGLHCWYLNFPKYTTYIPLPTVQSILWANGKMVVGSNQSSLYEATVDGKLRTSSVVAAKSIYSIAAHSSDSNPWVAVGGVGPQVDIFSSTKSFSLIANSIPL